MAQIIKNLLALQETQVRSLGGEEALEKGRTTRYSILAWRIPWTEKPGGLYVHRVANSWTQLSKSHFHLLICTLDIKIELLSQHLEYIYFRPL